jgi:very-short-patch-repair endonuclease
MGLTRLPCDPIEVTLPRLGRTSRLAGVSLTRSDMDRPEVDCVRDLPATSSSRTVADLARRLPDIDGVIVVELGVTRRVTDLRRLSVWAGTHSRYRGIERLRRAVNLAEPGSESPMETRLRMLLVSGGLPRPRVQVALFDETGMFIARADLLYPAQRLVIEYDGTTHRDWLQSDNRRQNRLIDAGYRVLRFTASDVFTSPAAAVALVRRTLFDRFAELPAPRLG